MSEREKSNLIVNFRTKDGQGPEELLAVDVACAEDVFSGTQHVPHACPNGDARIGTISLIEAKLSEVIIKISHHGRSENTWSIETTAPREMKMDMGIAS